MAERVKKEDFIHPFAVRMNTDDGTAVAWIDGVVEALYESLKAGKGVTFPGFGGFYVRPEPESWVCKFNPGLVSVCVPFSVGHQPIQVHAKNWPGRYVEIGAGSVFLYSIVQ